MSFDCCVLQPIRSHGGASPPPSCDCGVQSSISIWSYQTINLLVDQEPLSLSHSFSVPGCSWGPCAESKYLNRLQSYTGLHLSCLRENKHSKIERRVAFLLQSAWPVTWYAAKSIHWSLINTLTTVWLFWGKPQIYTNHSTKFDHLAQCIVLFLLTMSFTL